jgi:hypothetical protein
MQLRLVRPGVALLLCALLAACSGGLPAFESKTVQIGRANAAGLNYLYVASHSHRNVRSIRRYLLHDGIPESTPDLTYGGVGGLIAVAGDGTLYAVMPKGDGQVIDAFRPGETRPNRKIAVPNLERCFPRGSGGTRALAVAADTSGYAFVALYTYFGAYPNVHARPCEGVYVYAPTANGHAKAVQTIGFPRATAVDGLAVDPNDDLYVLQNQSVVTEFANATTGPRSVRVFRRGEDRHIQSVAADAAGNVYIGKDHSDYSSGRINRYTATDNPNGRPASSIVLTSEGMHYLSALAVLSHHVFLSDDYENVEVYRALERGPQEPIFTLRMRNVDSIATGP